MLIFADKVNYRQIRFPDLPLSKANHEISSMHAPWRLATPTVVVFSD